jgi:hypothetical protein
MEKPDPIKLPEDLEKEALIAKEREIKERIEKYRIEGTLFTHLIDFLEDFEKRITTFNHYLQVYIPYPTISRTVKNIVRDKLRTVNEFYNSFNGSNPYPIISEFDKKNDQQSVKLRLLYHRISGLIEQLNKYIQSVSEKSVVSYKSEPTYFTFDWT